MSRTLKVGGSNPSEGVFLGVAQRQSASFGNLKSGFRNSPPRLVYQNLKLGLWSSRLFGLGHFPFKEASEMIMRVRVPSALFFCFHSLMVKQQAYTLY